MALGARHTGARILREDLSWASVEPRPGRYRWARTDEWIGIAARYGLTVLPILDDVPPWLASNPTTIPRRATAYSAFAARVVQRYGPGGGFWRRHPGLARFAPVWFELFNEPYLPQTSAGHPDAGRYARLVRATVPRARRANPEARFLVAAETSYHPRDGVTGDWTKGLYRAVPNFGRFFDGLSIHPYSLHPPDDASPRGIEYETRRLEQIHQTLLDHGDGARPIWATEIGWSTCGDRSECVGVGDQARYLRSFFHLVRTRWPYVTAVAVYALHDYRPTGGEQPKEGSFGLVRIDRRPKPSYRVYKQAAEGR